MRSDAEVEMYVHDVLRQIKKLDERYTAGLRVLGERIDNIGKRGQRGSMIAASTGGSAVGGGLDPDGVKTIGYDEHDEPLKGYGPGARLTSEYGEDDAAVGRAIKAIAVGGDSKDLSGASDSAGGYLLSEALSARVVDLARARATAIQAGVVTVPIRGDTRVAKLASDPVPTWRAENVDLATSEPSFSSDAFRPKTLGVYVTASIELVEDSPNIEQAIETSLAGALGNELDRVILVGTGAANEPRGIEATPGVNTITAVGTPADATPDDHISNAIQDIEEANGTASAWIGAPRDFGLLNRKRDSTYQPIAPLPDVAKLRRFSTTQVPIDRGAGSDESLAFVGGFEQVWLGIRKQVSVEASRLPGFSTYSLAVRAVLRADVIVVRPAFLTVLSGITTS